MPCMVPAIILIILGILFPKGAKYLLAAPIIGICLGGFSWAVIGLITGGLNSSVAIGGFFIGGIVIAEIWAFKCDD